VKAIKLAIALTGCLLIAGQAQAAGSAITIGTFTAEKTCTTYELQWGREFSASAGSSSASGAVDAYGAAYGSSSRYASVYARSWGTELRRECEQNFPQMRSTIADALGSAGPVTGGGSGMVLSGSVTNVGYDAQSVGTSGSQISDQFMVVAVEYKLRNKAGQIVFSGALTKRLNIATGAETADVTYTRTQSGRTTFAQIQQQVGYAVARAVIFHLNPLRIVQNDGQSVALNYGTPLVPLGSAVIVAGGNSLRGRRLTVTSSMDGRAVAESDAHVILADVAPGTTATFVEADDPAANSRVHERVELPEN
jgi:hypothetical protein